MSDLMLGKCVMAIGPQQLNRLSETLATVTYPVGDTTVLSVQPDGSIELRPEGTGGPYEICLVHADRLIYAPLGVGGPVFLFPYSAVLPNA